jgi:streptogramin lyase/tRNA A-37 threonylcarbamoyl transferase component Bud32
VTDPRTLEPGDEFAGYRIEREIGRGGMGIVYLAEHLRLKKNRALKLLPTELAQDESFRRRFERESQLAAAIEHPNIIPIHDAGEAEGLLYISMRYIEGLDLKQLIDREGPLAAGRVMVLLEQVASALDSAHERKLVHRDVKPQNTLVAPGFDRTNREHAYLTDFGLTKHYESRSGMTKTGTIVGTIDYMAPEQLDARDVDGRADVYSLGCMLYECLSGEVPYDRPSVTSVIMAHLSAPLPRVTEKRPDLPPGIDEVIGKAMSKDRDERYPSCGEFIEAAIGVLGASALPGTTVAGASWAGPAPAHTTVSAPPAHAGVVSGETVVARGSARPPQRSTAPEPASIEQAPPVRRATPLLPIVAAAVVLALAGLGAFLLLGNSDDARPAGEGTAAKANPVEDVVGPGPDATVAATIPVGDFSTGIAFGEGAVWVTSEDDDTLRKIDPSTGEVVEKIPLVGASNPSQVRVGEGFVWVVDGTNSTIYRLDPETDQLAGTPIRLSDVPGAPNPVNPEDIAVGEGAVWTANTGGKGKGTLAHLDPATGEPVGDIVPMANSGAIAIGFGSLWVPDLDGNVVRELDVDTGEVEREIPVQSPGFEPGMIAVGEDAVWVTNNFDAQTIVRIDPQEGRPVGQPVELEASGPIAIGDGWVWVVGSLIGEDAFLTRIDEPSGEIVGEPLDVGKGAGGVAVGGGSVWVLKTFAKGVVQQVK